MFAEPFNILFEVMNKVSLPEISALFKTFYAARCEFNRYVAPSYYYAALVVTTTNNKQQKTAP